MNYLKQNSRTGSLGITQPKLKLQKLADVIKLNSKEEFYRSLVGSFGQAPTVIGGTPIDWVSNNRELWESSTWFPEQMMLLDSVSYLPDDLLTKVDRSSMSCGLEVRAPFLDSRLIEFALRLPPKQKISGLSSKVVLKHLLNQYVPNDLINRPKSGFAVPISAWLKGSLREWAEDLLSKEKLDSEGYLESSVIRSLWKEHLSSKRDNHSVLWAPLMFQAWLSNQN